MLSTSGSISATKLLSVFENTKRVLAIELLSACQALSFRRPLESGKGVEDLYQNVRSKIPFVKKDRELAPLIETALSIVEGNG